MQLNNKLGQQSQWGSRYYFDPKSGFLIADDYEVQFDYKPFKKVVEGFTQLIKSGEIIEVVENFPQFEYKCKDYRSKWALHQIISCLVNGYIMKLKQREQHIQNIAIPFSLAKPLYQVSHDLGVKYGLLSIYYNWYLQNKEADMEDLKIEDIKLRYYFTECEVGERYFFGASVVATHFFAKIIKLIFEINQIIDFSPEKQDLVAQKLKKIKGYLQKIVIQAKQLSANLDPHYFYHDLRLYLFSYKDVIFRGVEDGGDKIISSVGGNAGYDPSFQVFERGFGICFEGNYETIQIKLQEGMPINCRQLIKQMKEYSKIREYCSCTQYQTGIFNQIIGKYVDFLREHSTMVTNFVMKFESNKNQALGVSQTKIVNFIHRYKAVQCQKIPTNKQ